MTDTTEDRADEQEQPGRRQMARDRTELAEDRTVLAHERSFAGWVRTGMAAVGIGLAFNALFQSMEPVWAPKAIATVFLVIAAYIFLSGARRACGVLSRLETHKVKALRPVRIRLLGWTLTIATLALGVAIWWLG